MILAVTDANIFIDLLHIDCLHYLFRLDLQIHTTYEVLNELYDHQKEELLKYGKTGELTIDYGFNFKTKNVKISEGLADADRSVLYYAFHLKAGVLTGDYALKKKAAEYFEVHGILWVLERIVEKKFLKGKEACEALTILKNKKTRLPEKECEELVRKWKGKF